MRADARQLGGVSGEFLPEEKLADVLSIDVDWSTLKGAAGPAFEVLVNALQRRLVSPAIRTSSRDEFMQLWSREEWRVREILRSIDVVLREALDDDAHRGTRARLPRAERSLSDAVADSVYASGWHAQSQNLQQSNALVSRARKSVEDSLARGMHVAAGLVEEYRDALDLYNLGIILCEEATSHGPALIPEMATRADLIDDCVAVADEGARIAGVCALQIAGVEIRSDDSAWIQAMFGNVETVSFLLDAYRHARAIFGPDVRVALERVVEPEAPEQFTDFFIISTSLEPKVAVEQLDRLCDEWWREERDRLPSPIYPSLESHAT